MIQKREIKTVIYLFVLLLIQSCSSESTGNLVENDTTPPIIKSFTVNNIADNKIKAPIVISTTLELTIDAIDNVEVTDVQVFIDDVKVSNSTAAPFKFTINVSNYSAGNHLLKIKALDAAENTTLSKEIAFVLDNSLPSISNISIDEGAIIKGTNTLTFKVNDDVGIDNVAVLFDGTPIANITNGNYTISLPTANISDGKHTIEIIATDSNKNASKKLINFISDNTGPTIVINAINANDAISDIIKFSPKVTDAYSEISSFEVLFRNKRIQFFDNATIDSFDFDPNAYATGVGIFKFIAKDALGNTSELSINTTLEQIQALIKIKIPQDYFSTNIVKSWVFASKMDGTPINTVRIVPGMTETTLNSSEAFSNTDNFMITFFDVLSNGSNRISTIQHLTTSSPGTMHLPSLNPYSKDSEATYDLKNFATYNNIKSAGLDYKGKKLSNSQFKLEYLKPKKTNRMYFYSHGASDPASYTYQYVNSPVNNSFSLNSTDFSNQDVTVNQFTLKNYYPAIDLKSVLTIHGFDNQNDYANNVYHELFNQKFYTATLPLTYPLNTNFDVYKHRLVSENYITERKGTPLANFEKPNWKVKYEGVSGNTVEITTSGAAHNVGRLWLKNKNSMGATNDYSWTFVYDSQKNNTEVIIPRLPDALMNLDFYTLTKNNNLFWQVKQVEVTGYDNIATYKEYVNNILKNNTKYYTVSNHVESVYYVFGFKEYPVFIKDLFN